MQANTIPATFWALAFLLLPDNQDHKQQILLALQSTRLPDRHTSVPDAQAQQQKSHNGRLSAAVGSSEAVAAGMATAAPGFDAAAHTKVPAAKDPETAASEAAARALDAQIAAPDARGPYSKGCLSLKSEFNSDLSEQCGCNVHNALCLACASVACLILLSLHAPNCCYKCQQICSCSDQTHVAFVHADVTSVHTHFTSCYQANVAIAPYPCCYLQLCWLIQKCCHILAFVKPSWAFLSTCYNPPTAVHPTFCEWLTCGMQAMTVW